MNNMYDRISDDMYFIGSNVVLRFTVVLAKYSDTYGRESYYKEFEYRNRYGLDAVTIRRNFSYYLSIDNVRADENGNRESIKIGPEDMIMFRKVLNKVSEWFLSNKHRDLFSVIDNKLVLSKHLEPITLPYLSNGKYINFEPIVCYLQEVSSPGVRMYLSSDTNIVDIPVNKLFGLLYLIENMNLYESAQLLLNYCQKPEDGTNRISFNISEPLQEGTVVGKIGKKVEYKRNFFSMMDGV